MKVAIIGGTFNPIHNGHLHIAKCALNEFNLDKAIFIPTGVSYMKQGVSASFHRLKMTELAIEGNSKYEVSDIEVKRTGYTYTKDTVSYFLENFPDYELFFVIGTDTLFKIETWKEPEYLFKNMTFLVADRGDKDSFEKAEYLKNKYNTDIRFMTCEFLNISSTNIRNLFYEDKPIPKDFLPDGVKRYIIDNNLYTNITKDRMIEFLEQDLKPTRVTHTFGVRDLAVKLASIYNVDVNKAETAALLHDCAKYVSKEDKLTLCNHYNQEVSEFELNNDGLLHAKAGACLAIDKYHIYDEEVFNAIKYHTTGRPDMNMLEKIIFTADYCEVNRTHSDKLPYYRELAETNIEKVVAMILKDTLEYLGEDINKKAKTIDPMTRESFLFYEKYL